MIKKLGARSVMVKPPPPFNLFTTLCYDPRLILIGQNSEMSTPPAASALYMLAYHRDRIVQAGQHFGWGAVTTAFQGDLALINLQATILSKLDTSSQTPMRIKLIVHYHGTITIETSPTSPVDLANLFPTRIPPPASASSIKGSPLTGGALTLGSNDTVAGDPVKSEAWIVIPDRMRTIPTSFTKYKTTERYVYDIARKGVDIKDFKEKREVLLVSEKDGEIMEGSLTNCYFWRGGQWVTPSVDCGGQTGTVRRLCVEGVVKFNELVDGEECWLSNGVRGLVWGKIQLNKA
ncbi:hypothetical protein B7494_g5006 [Chlorociboria aeruginascens]|nr:hypothetical protein B7494_g5006 [Chlorociboria aeruginascens]